MNALVLLPTYNERDSLPIVVSGVLEHRGVRMLIIDDDSPDGTGGLADDMARQHPGRVSVLHRVGPRGLGLAYLDGFRAALASDADFICQMDADLSHDPAFLPRLLASARDGADLTIGSRYVRGGAVENWPLRRKVLSALANAYVRGVTRLHVRDCTSGYRCWRRDALARVPLTAIRSDGYAFLVEVAYLAVHSGATTAEVPIVFTERRFGTSKLSGSVLIESLLTPWRMSRSHRPVKAAGFNETRSTLSNIARTVRAPDQPALPRR